MDNNQKRELRMIIRGIPVSEYSKSISRLWKIYGYGFTYGTFKMYFKVFKLKKHLQSAVGKSNYLISNN